MSFEFTFLGSGLGTSRGLVNLLKRLRNKRIKKKINIGVIDQDLNNFTGGIAYTKSLSEHGFLNNPARLCPQEFIKWVINRDNSNLLLKKTKLSKSQSYKKWVKENEKILLKSKSINDQDEIYYPRFFLSQWLQNIITRELNLKRKNIEIRFINGKAISIKKKNKKLIIFLDKGKKIKNSSFIKKNRYKILEDKKKILSKKILISLGLPESKNPYGKDLSNDKFFVPDLYNSGGTQKILNLIKKKKLKKIIKIHFLGTKAGFLECLPEISNLIKMKKIKLKLIATSSNATTLQPALKSKNYKKYYFKFLKKQNLKKINTPEKLFKNIIKEFEAAKKNSFNKYDSWTKILSEEIIKKILKNFSKKNKKLYNEKYFREIRNLTRFTYPETVASLKDLINKNVVTMNKGKILKIDKKKGIFKTTTINKFGRKKNIYSDIVVSVLGPQNINELIKKNSLYYDLSNINNNEVLSDGLVVDNFFRLKNCKNISLIGFVSSGYNAKRETILKAITNNSIKATNKLAQF